jgi:CubicO group peptidase (beta-lactamase class C family)
MQRDAIFRIHSMSKPITAFALLQLVDQGKVALDDDIRKYLPQFAPFEHDGEPQVITVHQLLSHTAGFGYGGGFRNWIDIRYLLANPLSRNNSLRDMVGDLSGIELKFTPGSKFGYSIASDVQGAIIEAVAKVPLDSYLQQHVFTPLQMKDTGFYVPRSERHRLVDMYEHETESIEEAAVFNNSKVSFSEKGARSEFLVKPRLLSGGGGLVSTAADYINFTTMLRNKGKFGGRALLSRALVERMLSSHTTGLDMGIVSRLYPGGGFGYGIGVAESPGVARSPGSFYWAGLGGTLFWVDPVTDVQVIVMMQLEDGWVAMDRWMPAEVEGLLARQGTSSPLATAGTATIPRGR